MHLVHQPLIRAEVVRRLRIGSCSGGWIEFRCVSSCALRHGLVRLFRFAREFVMRMFAWVSRVGVPQESRLVALWVKCRLRVSVDAGCSTQMTTHDSRNVRQGMTTSPTRPSGRRSSATRSVAVIASLALLVSGFLSACSSDSKESADKPTPSEPESSAPPAMVTQATLGAIAGKLPVEQRQVVQDDVTAVVEEYTDWAFLAGDYPRTDWDFPVPNATTRISRRLRQDVMLATNADIGADISAVTPVSRSVTVDVLAPKGEPAGATARFTVVFDTTGAGDAQVTARGRLVLVPEADGWQIVGYYLAKEAS